MDDLSSRQVHLDFHTSQYITEVGKDFDAEEFAEALRRAHVNCQMPPWVALLSVQGKFGTYASAP